MQKTLRIMLICFSSIILNYLTASVFYQYLKLPFFFDTIWTVAVVFYLGLVPGLCVSIGYNLLNLIVWFYKTGANGLFIALYSICGILIVISTWVFARKKTEFRISPTVTILYLVLISMVSSLCSIVLGGILDYFQYKILEVSAQMNPIRKITEAFLYQRFSLLASCILAQIPISFLDRLIATFSGYGIFCLATRIEYSIHGGKNA